MPVYGTPHQRAALLAADTVVLVEHGGMLSDGGYDLVSADGALLGSVSEQTSVAGFFFGGAASSSFALQDEQGVLVATMYRPGSVGRFVFEVSDASGAGLGVIEQVNTFMAPRFLLQPVDGTPLRMVGGTFTRPDWDLLDAEETVIGQVVHEFAGLGGMLSGTQRFVLRLAPQVSGASRVLALLAVVCLDFVRDQKDS